MSIPYIPADTSKPNYTVDHSGNLVIIGPDGEQHGFIRAPLNNAKLEAQLPGVLAAGLIPFLPTVRGAASGPAHADAGCRLPGRPR